MSKVSLFCERRLVASVVAVAAVVSSTACELAMHDRSSASEEWTRSYEARDVEALTIETPNGRVSVTGSDRPDLRVVATKRATGLSAEATQTLLGATEIKEERDGGRTRLRVETPKGLGLLAHGGVEVDFSVEVPRTTPVTVETVNGTVRADTIDGALSLRTVNGRIDARQVGGPVQASTVNGRIALSLAAIAPGGITAKTVNGAVGITVPADEAATLAASCVNCSVKTEGLSVERSEAPANQDRKHTLHGTLNGGGPSIAVTTVNGSIRFVAPDGDPARLVERESERQP